ncbi:MAG: hypothetical protein M3R17_04985 [Bacteroidota bacterium]|nr:hypothetical protein [Bacteroidota bacterium]
MKNRKLTIVLSLGIVLLLSACGSDKRDEARIDSLNSLSVPVDTTSQLPPKTDSDSVKVITPKPETETGKEVAVNEGIVYCTLPYCGGAKPSEEIVANKKKSILLTYSTLKLKSKTAEYVVTTNDKGIFRSGIPAGQYDVYLTKETNKKIYDVSPEKCANCLTKPMANVIIQKGIQASFVIHFNCGPDDKWRP